MEDNNEVEIELTLESGLVVDFLPEFRMQQNTADHSSVQWRLSSSRDASDVVILRDELQAEESIHSTIFSSTDV